MEEFKNLKLNNKCREALLEIIEKTQERIKSELTDVNIDDVVKLQIEYKVLKRIKSEINRNYLKQKNRG